MLCCLKLILGKYFAVNFPLDDPYIHSRCIEAKYLLMPVLSEPDHLIHNAFQGGQKGWMQFPLHVHDPAASPHWGSGSDGPRV